HPGEAGAHEGERPEMPDAVDLEDPHVAQREEHPHQDEDRAEDGPRDHQGVSNDDRPPPVPAPPAEDAHDRVFHDRLRRRGCPPASRGHYGGPRPAGRSIRPAKEARRGTATGPSLLGWAGAARRYSPASRGGAAAWRPPRPNLNPAPIPVVPT